MASKDEISNTSQSGESDGNKTTKSNNGGDGEDASSMTTGSSLMIDGGWTAR